MSNYTEMKELSRKQPKFDREKIMKAVTMLLEALGDDPNRSGLKGTPDRVARMYEEVFEGMLYTNDEIAEMFSTSFEEPGNDGLVVIQDIPIFSHCEHHLALMYDMKIHIAYLPTGKVIGLSKAARIADMVSKRLQLQERIGHDVAQIIMKVCETPDVAVIVEGKHSCMTARGAKKAGSSTRTAAIYGRFKEVPALRAELYSLIGK